MVKNKLIIFLLILLLFLAGCGDKNEYDKIIVGEAKKTEVLPKDNQDITSNTEEIIEETKKQKLIDSIKDSDKERSSIPPPTLGD